MPLLYLYPMKPLREHALDNQSTATRLGFEFCPHYAKAGIFRGRSSQIGNTRSHQKLTKGQMGFLANQIFLTSELDSYPSWVDDAKTVSGSLSYNYYPSESLPNPPQTISLQICLRRDYNLVIREKLNKLFRDPSGRNSEEIKADGHCGIRTVLERQWAQKAGIGLDLGKTACFLNRCGLRIRSENSFGERMGIFSLLNI